MKILQVHNEYRQRGGEWTVLQQEYELLSRHHTVDQYIVKNSDELNGVLSKARLLFTTHYNRKSKNHIAQALRDGSYDMMHVHNFFPLLSPSVFDAAAELGIPSVMTLHNYRLIHPNGLLFNRGEVDESTLKGSAYRAVASGAYRGSRLQTAVVARMIETHRKRGTWNRVPDRLIALTGFAKHKFSEGGIPEERIAVKPNFIRDPLPGLKPSTDSGIERGFIYAGRIEKEKGIDELIEAWIERDIKYPLLIAGNGTKKEYLEKLSSRNRAIKWLGSVDRDELLSLMRASLALIFPSRWYEGMPMTILEAKALGCPVITADIGNHADLVNDGADGLHYQSGEISDLSEKVEIIASDPELRERLSKGSRKDYERHYTPDRNYSLLMKIYEETSEVRRRADSV